MARIISVYDLFSLKFGILEVNDQTQIDSSGIQIDRQPLHDVRFIKDGNARSHL